MSDDREQAQGRHDENEPSLSEQRSGPWYHSNRCHDAREQRHKRHLHRMEDPVEGHEAGDTFEGGDETRVDLGGRLGISEFVEAVERAGDVDHVVERLVEQDQCGQRGAGEEKRVGTGRIFDEVVPLPTARTPRATATRPSVV